MAMYSTFFLAERDMLPSGFPGWRREEATALAGEAAAELPRYEVTMIGGDYAAYLEARIPPFVRSQPHWCAKGLCSVELNPLIAAVTADETANLAPALFAPPSVPGILEEFPAEFLSQLQSAEELAVRRIARNWATVMSTPRFTHSVTGVRVEEDWTLDTALSLLRPIVKLCKEGLGDQQIYLLVEY